RLAPRTRSVMLMMPVCPESGFLGRVTRPWLTSEPALRWNPMPTNLPMRQSGTASQEALQPLEYPRPSHECRVYAARGELEVHGRGHPRRMNGQTGAAPRLLGPPGRGLGPSGAWPRPLDVTRAAGRRRGRPGRPGDGDFLGISVSRTCRNDSFESNLSKHDFRRSSRASAGARR